MVWTMLPVEPFMHFRVMKRMLFYFSLALTDITGRGTCSWLKNNKELINVAVSRAKDQLIVLSSSKELERLHDGDDDLYELVQYVKHNGQTNVTPKTNASRALGIKPYSTKRNRLFWRI